MMTAMSPRYSYLMAVGKSPIAVVEFMDGPKAGDKISVSADAPPKMLKLGFPEWAVYEHRDGAYYVKFVGDMARAWRSPRSNPFVSRPAP